MTVRFRAVEEADLEEAAELYCDVFNRPLWNDEWTRNDARLRLEEIVETPAYRGYLAEETGTLVGVARGNLERWYNGQRFYLKEMYVAPDRQRAGIGTA